jgi:uncharacterized Zn-binding protein involved in type VI secretion
VPGPAARAGDTVLQGGPHCHSTHGPPVGPTPPAPVPHPPVSLSIGSGALTVSIGGAPAAIMGVPVPCKSPPCTPGPVGSIVKGFPQVLIEGKPIACIGDQTLHPGCSIPPGSAVQGTIMSGCPTVLIGTGMTAAIPAMAGTANAGIAAVTARAKAGETRGDGQAGSVGGVQFNGTIIDDKIESDGQLQSKETNAAAGSTASESTQPPDSEPLSENSGKAGTAPTQTDQTGSRSTQRSVTHHKVRDDSGRGGDAPETGRGNRPVPDTQAETTNIQKRQVVSIEWGDKEAFCSQEVFISVKTKNFTDGQQLTIEFKDQASGKTVGQRTFKVHKNRVYQPFVLNDIARNAAGEMRIHAVAGRSTPVPLRLKFIANAAEMAHQERSYGFHLAVKDYETKVRVRFNYVQGWSGLILKLGNCVPADTGGLIEGLWGGQYRFAKKSLLWWQYWNGTEWINVPMKFRPKASNYHSVPFIRRGAAFSHPSDAKVRWPERFNDWDLANPKHVKEIRCWEKAIAEYWSDRFALRRRKCTSKDDHCCAYPVQASAKFVEKKKHSGQMLVFAEGPGRANTRLFFLRGNIDRTNRTAAHEYGHYLVNPDEYEGAGWIDRTYNSDGAKNGIDKTSLMGSGRTVKRRHYYKISRHMITVVKNTVGERMTFEIVKA